MAALVGGSQGHSGRDHHVGLKGRPDPSSGGLDGAIVSEWKWVPIPSAVESQVSLTTRRVQELSVLSPYTQLSEREFVVPSTHEQVSPDALSKAFDFIRENGRITGTNFENGSTITSTLWYHIPCAQRANLGPMGTMIDIASIAFPRHNEQAVRVEIKALSSINKQIVCPWTQETYNKIREFVIYYINQLDRDNAHRKRTPHGMFINSTKTDNRVYAIYNSPDAAAARKYLCEECPELDTMLRIAAVERYSIK